MRSSKTTAIVTPFALALAACAGPSQTDAQHDAMSGDAKLQRQLADTRQATAKYRDVQAAVAAKYTKFPDLKGDCVAEPGKGGMGVHYLNASLVDTTVDAARPELLVYHPGAGGRLELVALEYAVPAAQWDATHAQPPELFGHGFHLLRTPNRYGLDAPLYTLHVWLWKQNPDGLFNDWNQHVSCM